MKAHFKYAFAIATASILISSFTLIKSEKKMETTTTVVSFYSLSIKSLDGSKTINFSDFKGKKVLCVNVASECGYTPQYKDLQELSEKYQDKLVIIGFPCNQFGGQEPGNASDISTFCQKNYGVTFLLTEKIDVKGDKQHSIYKWLTNKVLNGKEDSEVKWNFNKFLIDENGNWIAYFPSKTKPLSEELETLIK